jgi:hypothetical protein
MRTMNMTRIRSPFAVLFLLGLLPAPLFAQELKIAPGEVVTEGDTVTFDYSDPSSPGITIFIEVSGGEPPETVELGVTLDANGKGSTTWKARSGWRKAYVIAPGVEEQLIEIEPAKLTAEALPVAASVRESRWLARRPAALLACPPSRLRR